MRCSNGVELSLVLTNDIAVSIERKEALTSTSISLICEIRLKADERSISIFKWSHHCNSNTPSKG